MIVSADPDTAKDHHYLSLDFVEKQGRRGKGERAQVTP